MKRKEIDVFGILMGIVIGFLFGYFLNMRINKGKTDEVGTDKPSFGNIYLLQILKSNNITDIHNTLNGAEFSYEIIQTGDTYYVYGSISNEEAVINTRKEDYIDYGFNPTIKNEYILDWPNYYLDDQEKYNFYCNNVSRYFTYIWMYEKYYRK